MTEKQRTVFHEGNEAFLTLISEMKWQSEMMRKAANLFEWKADEMAYEMRGFSELRIDEKELEAKLRSAIEHAEYAVDKFKSTADSVLALVRGEEVILRLTCGASGIQDERNDHSCNRESCDKDPQ